MSTEPRDWSRRYFLSAGAALASIGLGACGLDRASSPDPSAEAEPAGEWSGDALDPPWDKPDVTFTDLDGNPFPFVDSTAGKLSLLFFGYTNCPDICPVYLQTLARARQAISTGPGSKPDVYFVGVDLARDTPQQVKGYLANIDETFIGLTGSEDLLLEAVDAVYGGIKIGESDANGGYSVGHPGWATVYLDDNKAHRRYPFGARQQDWVKDLPRLARGDYK